ncbi:MAG: WD40 repeat domain-containing protein [Proteobacteria bacterium]|nr:WD40 repeat domain-containing protein [Pseudomonadota bacterium]
MIRSGNRWRSAVALAAGVLAALVVFASASAQTALPVYDPESVALLAFRPGKVDMVLLAISDAQGRLQVDVVQVTRGGRAEIVRTLPGIFASAAWLDGDHIVTGADDGRLERWPLDGSAPDTLATLAEPILGIGTAPVSRDLALRLSQTLRLVAADGRPNGPTITLGQPTEPGATCPPAGIERAPAFSPDERLLAFSGLCGDLRIVRQDGARLMPADIQHPYVKRYAFSADGSALVTAYGASGGADILPVAPEHLGVPRPLDGIDGPADAAGLPNKQGFLVLSADRLHFLDPDGHLLHDEAAPNGSTRIAVASDGTRIVVAAAEGLVLLAGDGQRLARPFGDFGHPIATHAIAGGTQLAALHADGRLQVWQLDGRESREALQLWKSGPAASGADDRPPRLLVSPSGRKVGVLAPDTQFEVFDQNWNRVGRPMRFPTGPQDLTLAGTLLLDDRILRPMPDGTGFLVLDLDGRVLGRMAFGGQEKFVPEAAVASSGVIAIYTSDGRLVAWTREGQPIRQRKLAVSGLTAPRLDISADGKMVVLHDTPPNLPPHLLVWKLDGEDNLESRDGTFAGLLPDGSLLRVSNRRLVLDAPDGAQKLSLPFDGDRVVGVTPDGKLALVAKRASVHAVAIAPGNL